MPADPRQAAGDSRPGRRGRKLTAVIAGGWLIGCGLLMSARWIWLGELIAHFQPFMGAIGLLLATALAFGRRPRGAVTVLLISTYLLAPMVRFLPRDERPQAEGPRVRVATMNLHRDRPEHLDLAPWLSRHKPDIVAFQEVSEPTARHLVELLSGEGYVSLLPRDLEDWTPGIYGQVLFTRLQIRSLERVHDGWLGGGLFDAHLDLDGRDLHLVCGQPIRPGGGGYTAGRDQALAKMATLARDHANTVLLGDLNTTSFSPVFQDLLEKGRLHDSRDGIGWQPSFSPLDRLPIFFPLLAIDHVLLGSDLLTTHREVTETIGSDHWPVIADIGFTARP